MDQEERKVPFKVRSKFEYQSTDEDDLTFSPNQIITVTYIEDESWFQGTYNGKSGIFPRDFVEILPGEIVPEVSQLPIEKIQEPEAIEEESVATQVDGTINDDGIAGKDNIGGKDRIGDESDESDDGDGDESNEKVDSVLAPKMETKATPFGSKPPIPSIPVPMPFSQRIEDPYAIKKLFIGAGKSSYVPPIVARDQSNVVHGFHDVVANTEIVREHDEQLEEEAPQPKMSLKERIAMLEASRKEQAKREAAALQKAEERKKAKAALKKQNISALLEPPSIPSHGTGNVFEESVLSGDTTKDERTTIGDPKNDEEALSTINLEQSELDEASVGQADELVEEEGEADEDSGSLLDQQLQDEKQDQNDEQNDQEEQEDEDDEDLKRQRLIARMAKVSGGRNMFGMMGMTPHFDPSSGGLLTVKGNKSVKSDDKKEIDTKSHETPASPNAPSAPAIPQSAMPLPGLAQSAKKEQLETRIEKLAPKETELLLDEPFSPTAGQKEEPNQQEVEKEDQYSLDDPTKVEQEYIEPVSQEVTTEKEELLDTESVPYPSEDILKLSDVIPTHKMPLPPPQTGDGMPPLPTTTSVAQEYKRTAAPPPPLSSVPPVPPVPQLSQLTQLKLPPIPPVPTGVPIPAIPPIPKAAPPPPVSQVPQIPPVPISHHAPPPPPPTGAPQPSLMSNSLESPSMNAGYEKSPIQATRSEHEITDERDVNVLSAEDDLEYGISPTSVEPSRAKTFSHPESQFVPEENVQRRKSLHERIKSSKISSTTSNRTEGVASEMALAGLAKDLEDLRADISWLLKNDVPPVLQPKVDIELVYEVDTSSISKRGGRVVVFKDYYILYHDLSQIVMELQYDQYDPEKTALLINLRTENVPPVKSNALQDSAASFGIMALKYAESLEGQKLSSGIVGEVFSSLKNAHLGVLNPIGQKAFGFMVYKHSNANVVKFDDIKPGDIVCMKNAKFPAHKGLKSIALKPIIVGEHDDIYSAIVLEHDTKKDKIRVLENDSNGTVKKEGYRIGEMKSGHIRIFRIIRRKYIGWPDKATAE